MNATDELIGEIERAARDARRELGFEPLPRIAIRAAEVVLIALVKRLDRRFSTNGGNVYPYPDEMQTFEAASTLLAMIRGGTGTKADYFHAGYTLLGFATKQIVGAPGDVATVMAVPESQEAQEAALLRVMDACDPKVTTASVAALPPGFWKQIGKMVWEILKPILDDLLKGQPA